MRKETVEIRYEKNLSVNHYLGKRKGGGYYTKPGVLAWREEFGWMIKGLHLEDWKLPLHVTCSGVFKDKRSAPDLSNLSKVLLDTIEDTCGVNDKHYRWHDGTRKITGAEPYLILEFKEEE